MAFVEVKQLTFRFPGEPVPALQDVSFTVQSGQFVVMCGPSGCGKTTLLRHLKKELEPHGERSGDILYRGEPLSALSSRQAAQQIGMVMQDPENQIVLHEVKQELVFAMENLGFRTEVMRNRLAELAHFFGLEALLNKSTDELSGGRKQQLNLASVLLLQPSLLLLDEPTAQLDPVAAREFLQMVHRLNQELGITVIMTEHRLEEVFPLADQVLALEAGAVKYRGMPREVIHEVWFAQDRTFIEYMPSIPKFFLYQRQGLAEAPFSDIPLTVKEGRSWLQTVGAGYPEAHGRPNAHGYPEALDFPEAHGCPDAQADKPAVNLGYTDADVLASTADRQADNELVQIDDAMMRIKEVYFQYDRGEPLVLRQLDFNVRQGEFAALLGGNGAGKSTLLQIMAGLLQPQRGAVFFHDQKLSKMKDGEKFSKIGYLAQNPMLYFAHSTVEEELRHAAVRAGLSDADEAVNEMLSIFDIESLRNKHPYDCSGGEKQKTALACVLLSMPKLLLLDEPTKGLDPFSKRNLGETLLRLHKDGMTIVIATHDVEFAAEYATRCAMLFDGAITASGTPSLFFGDNFFYTTAVNRMVRDVMPQALIYEDVLQQWNERAMSR